jgi:hypothetical protein
VVLKIFYPVVIEPKCVTPAFDCLIGGGYAVGDLTVLFGFWFDEGAVVELPDPLLICGPCSLLFSLLSPTDGMAVFTMSINSIEVSSKSLHPLLLVDFALLHIFVQVFSLHTRCWLCMVHTKHTRHHINVRVSSEVESMASNEVLEASTLHREASAEVTSSQSLEDSDDCESWSGGSEDSEIASNDSERLKVVVPATAAGITYDFRVFSVVKAHIALMDNNVHYFPKGYFQPPRCRLSARASHERRCCV